MLELLDLEFKTNLFKMLRALKEKVDTMLEQIDNVSIFIEIPRKNQKKC